MSKAESTVSHLQSKIIRQYIMENKEPLIANLYMNILVGFNRFPKPYRFYKNLGERLDKTPAQTRQMFLQTEERFFTQFLEIPKEHYQLYSQIFGFQTSSNLNQVENLEAEIELLKRSFL